jgi:outer membrane protein assembly factor BamB
MQPTRHHLPVLAAMLFASFVARDARADDWPQWLGPQRDSVWRETGILQRFPTNGPPVRWRTPVGGGYSGPAVSGGRVYLTDREVATGSAKPADPMNPGLIRGSERVLCLDESSGSVLWRYEYPADYSMGFPAGPRATPVVAGGKVFTLGAEGNLFCFDTQSGKVLWSHDFKKEYGIQTPTWGFAGNPLLDGDRLICLVGGSNSTAVAFNKDTGAEVWRALTADDPGYAAPVIIDAAGKRQLIVWDPASVNSLDPVTGAVYWSRPLLTRMGMSIATPRKMGDLLFVTSFFNGSMALRLDAATPAASLVWQSKKISEKNTADLHCTTCTPFLEDGYVYGVCSYGQLRCIKADTGDRVWETLAATTYDNQPARWATAFIVKNGDRFFLFNEKGDLIIANLTPKGYDEISRAHILEPTNTDAGRPVVWSHPAFADRCMFARNDKEIVCVDLTEKK